MVPAEWSNDQSGGGARQGWMAGGAGARRRLPSPVLAGTVWIAICLLHSVLLPAQTGSQEQAGKHIYATGDSPSGSPLEAVLGEGSTTVPATLMPCVSCHGADGRGRPEGGITPSDITWSVLSRPLRSDDRLARKRPAYTVESLRKVLREGIDPAGNELGVTMPRYNITDADLNSLIEYMKHLGAEIDPGLSPASIRLGTVIPDAGPMAAAGENMAALLRAYFDEVNQQGGIYDRKIKLEVLRVHGTPSSINSQLDAFLRNNQVFAFVGVLAPGAEREVDEALEKAEVPVIDAFAAEREQDHSAKSRVYHVLSGLPQQARVLVKYAQERPDTKGTAAAVLFPQERKLLAEAVIEECRARACNLAAPIGYTIFDPAQMSADLRARKIGTIFFLGTGRELEQLLMAAQSTHWRPLILQPGPLAGEDVFRIAPEFSERVLFSFPTLPTDIAPVAFEEYAFLGRKYKLTPLPPLRALAALAPAKVLAEALRQAGRELSRDKLVETLSGMYNFPTGWTPPVSYGATRRVGALGAYVVKLNLNDKSFAPVEPWMVP
jgi:ABC-type branched-subunit amino acid transport system substrate-binding protein